MSAVSAPFRVRRAPDKIETVNKKVPENPRYSHVRPVVDSGASIRRYLERLKESQKNVKYKKGEVFKRIKLTTFVNLVIEVAKESLGGQNFDEEQKHCNLYESTSECRNLPEANQINRTLPPLQAQSECLVTDTPRSTFHSVVNGIGELDLKNEDNKPPLHGSKSSPPYANPTELSPLPYLLLDVRDKEDYQQCHIITARNYPYTMLCRSCNYETKDLLAYKNLPERIIVMYDDDETLSSRVATTFVQRGYENVFMLTGGLKLAAEKFPHCLITGILPPSCLPPLPKKVTSTSRGLLTARHQPSSTMTLSTQPATPLKDSFSKDDISILQAFLDGCMFSTTIRGQGSTITTNSRIHSDISKSREVVTAKPSGFRMAGKPRPWK